MLLIEFSFLYIALQFWKNVLFDLYRHVRFWNSELAIINHVENIKSRDFCKHKKKKRTRI